MQNKKLVYKGASVSYLVSGRGPTVVLLHGFGETGKIWQHQIDFLKLNFKLIVPDIPGSGQSDYIENADITIYADIVKNILEEEFNSDIPLINDENNKPEFIKCCTIIGHSMGGYIA